MKTSDLLVRCLEAEGVEYIFGLPGEETADLMISLPNSSIKFILTRHEQSAAFMADVYGRLTGELSYHILFYTRQDIILSYNMNYASICRIDMSPYDGVRR
jgi:thiamine pyrophosphate-dependent acetolactate synthase large subunit-like protein